MSEIQVRFLSQGAKEIDSKAQSVVLMVSDGLAEIFPGHADAYFKLGKGEILLRQGLVQHAFKVEGGVARLRADELMVLSGRIRPVLP